MTDVIPVHHRLTQHGNFSGWKFDYTCPAGEVLTSIYGEIGAEIDGMGGTCSDGTVLRYTGGRKKTTLDIRGRQSKVYGSITENDDMLFGIGNHRTDWTDTCPKDTYLSGYYGSYGSGKMNSLGFLCNVDKNDFCIKNIDNPICSTVNASVLNKACELDMLKKACKNRKFMFEHRLILCLTIKFYDSAPNHF